MLPNAASRWIPDDKIKLYLLSEQTPKAKARHDFFTGFGFTKAGWPAMKSALMDHAVTATVSMSRKDQYGTTYLAAGPLTTPDGRNPNIKAYWIIRHDDPRPQLTSVIPNP